MIDDYLARASRAGRALGLGPFEVREVEAKKPGPEAEADALSRALPANSILVAMDERGRTLSSPDFASRLADWRDAGRRHVTLVIGGADGLSPEFRNRADLVLSFGRMVWPHMLARVMLAEQLYRATQILAGTPYHRV